MTNKKVNNGQFTLNFEGLFSCKRPTLIIGIVTAILSIVSKWTIGGVELSGGATFTTIAALLIFWPLIPQIATRGGSAEFLGLKLQINNLEKRTEEDMALRLVELRSDIEELRMQIKSERVSIVKSISSEIKDDEGAFFSAVSEYRAHQDIHDWKSRVEVDKKLIAGAGRLPVQKLENILLQNPTDQEIAMATAVSLGSHYAEDSELQAIKLLVKLLESPFERVRYRAARSIERRARRADSSEAARKAMREGILNAINIERSAIVLEGLQDVLKTV